MRLSAASRKYQELGYIDDGMPAENTSQANDQKQEIGWDIFTGEELAADVFVKLAQKAHLFNKSGSFAAWLKTISKNIRHDNWESKDAADGFVKARKVDCDESYEDAIRRDLHHNHSGDHEQFLTKNRLLTPAWPNFLRTEMRLSS
jgi:hypothetical protein